LIPAWVPENRPVCFAGLSIEADTESGSGFPLATRRNPDAVVNDPRVEFHDRK
jgi:hypothetical protein